MEDEKTVEIVIPVKTPVPLQPKNSADVQIGKTNLPASGSTPARSQANSIALSVGWTDAVKRDLSEDWTLRLLAVVTILALSLLVL